MDNFSIDQFLDSTGEIGIDYWAEPSRNFPVPFPDLKIDDVQSLIYHDIKQIWIRWFVESVVDPWDYVKIAESDGLYVSSLRAKVKKVIDQRYCNQLQCTERKAIVNSISRKLQDIVKSIASKNSIRPRMDRNIRKELSQSARSRTKKIRCAICGYPFGENVEQNFLCSSRQDVESPPLVDLLKQHGKRERDLRIEIDHVKPLAQGGTNDIENLQLLCGWCNSHKSDYVSIYDIGIKMQRSLKPIRIGRNFRIQPPNQFHVVRMLSLIKKCQAKEDCSHTAYTSTMTVAPIYNEAALTINNLKVVCNEHSNENEDPRYNRLVPREWLTEQY